MIVDVGTPEDFPDGEPVIRTIDGREVGVIRWRTRWFAVRNVCPHQTGPLCRGFVRAKLAMGSRFGTVASDPTTPVLACPWHGWEFELASGRAVWDPGYGVRTYPVSVRDGRVLVDMQPPPGGATIAPSRDADRAAAS